MASGQHHDRATLGWSLPIGLAAGSLLGPTAGGIAFTAFLFGGLWLSPDLDTQSNALHRWGPLGVIWWPYRRLIPHRSIWSHGPLVGTAVRLLVLLGWTVLISSLVPAINPNKVLTALPWALQNHPQQTAALLLGLEASVWLHLLQDGDPWPAEWTRHQRRRRRR